MEDIEAPKRFSNPYKVNPHELAQIACNEVKHFLSNQSTIPHNFGLGKHSEIKPIGKMFGVLVVENEDNSIGYITAFSGKLAGGNHHAHFVPPVYDALTEGSFVNVGMTELTEINQEITKLREDNSNEGLGKLKTAIDNRRIHCTAILDKIVDSYFFLNSDGITLGLREIFEKKLNKKPPGGAGECALPKLLQFAFLNKLKPIATAEFWWGKTDKAKVMNHGEYYPSCTDKCEPILEHMLSGIELE